MKTKEDLKVDSDNYMNLSISFIYNYDFSNIQFDFSNRIDREMINHLFCKAIKHLYAAWERDYDGNIMTASCWFYAYNKIRNWLLPVFDLKVNPSAKTNKLFIMVGCNNKTKYYSYIDQEFSVINSDIFNQSETGIFNNVLKLKEMELTNDEY